MNELVRRKDISFPFFTEMNDVSLLLILFPSTLVTSGLQDCNVGLSFCINGTIILIIRLYRVCNTVVYRIADTSDKSFLLLKRYSQYSITQPPYRTLDNTQEVLYGGIILCRIQCLFLEHYCCRSSFSLLIIVYVAFLYILNFLSLYTTLLCCGHC